MHFCHTRIAVWRACLLVGLAVCAPAYLTAQTTAPMPKMLTQAAGPLSLADLEQIALQHNPTLVQAAARVDVSRGKALQAGLYPNPTIGYAGEQIGSQRSAGEFQGGFIQQEIVTAGKLRLSRAKYKQEAYQAEIQAMAQQLRVVNGIRIAYYEILAVQSSIENHRTLLKNADNAIKTTEELVNLGQANQPDLLQAQIEAQRSRVAMKTAENRYKRAWEHLVTMIGTPEMAPTPLAGKLELVGPPLQWEKSLAKLLQESPEMQFVQAEVVRDQISLKREQVEAIPNITVRAGLGYNYIPGEKSTVGNVQVGIRLPIFDRNQGTKRQAEAELARARAEVTRTELVLRRRLADTFTQYQNAYQSVDDYQKNTLPKARQAYELYQEYFKKRRATWPQVLVAERNYFGYTEEYINALIDLRRAEVEINGMLLSNGLDQPPAPTPGGHIEATPRPR
ncbi:MAG: TolC family protein [Planctomycetes bacterium]|nr:TolC family protein [Planctomycetota bacterium]